MSGLVALALIGCSASEPEEAPHAPIRVSVLSVQPQTMRVVEQLPGRVAAVRTAEIRPQISGIVQSRLFEQGTEVAAGTVLFQIYPAPFKAEVDSAAAALQRARAVLRRTQTQAERLAPLVKADAVSRQVYDDAVSQREQAAADVAQARATLARRQLDLTFSRVDAPISGRIDQALVTEGGLVSSSDSKPMATIQQIDQVYVDVRQAASSLESLRHALAETQDSKTASVPVQILTGSGKSSGLSGNILFSGINVDAGTGDVLLRILVDNPERQLLPGMYVQAQVTRAIYSRALLVPQQAVTHSGATAQVWVIDEEHQARRLAVDLGELVDRHYRITAGLKPGQQVVIEGAERLSDGVQVQAQPWSGTESTPLPADTAH
ncbi:efflux RND transporter periplasmic adaptor subunit [Alcaligenes aquatilis]|uniref:efflux RND transporter periplasmic adaptor subunit n=1 Tax=Alcaligenes aquatilis TaxID=323284 RepID=UPI003F92D473